MDDNHEINETDIINFFGYASTEDVKISSKKLVLLKAYGHILNCKECYDRYYYLKLQVIENQDLDFNPDFELLQQNEKLLERILLTN
jgi:hypothetical protein